MKQSTHEQLSGVREPGPSLSVAPVVSVLMYFDLFQYPLRFHEIVKFLPAHVADETLVARTMEQLQSEGIIHERDGFYSLEAISAERLQRRLRGNQAAQGRMHKAEKMAALIASFPFV